VAGDDQANKWKATERDLRAALASADLSTTSALQTEEYLDHNELGLAFEALIVELDQRGSGANSDTLTHLRSALERMSTSAFDTEYLDAWERVQRRPTS
jgi:hypothetical protein